MSSVISHGKKPNGLNWPRVLTILSQLPQPTPRTLPHTEKATMYTERRVLRFRGMAPLFSVHDALRVLHHLASRCICSTKLFKRIRFGVVAGSDVMSEEFKHRSPLRYKNHRACFFLVRWGLVAMVPLANLEAKRFIVLKF